MASGDHIERNPSEGPDPEDERRTVTRPMLDFLPDKPWIRFYCAKQIFTEALDDWSNPAWTEYLDELCAAMYAGIGMSSASEVRRYKSG